MARINFKTAAKKARAIRKKNPHMQWSTAMAEAIRSMQKKKTRRIAGVKKKPAPRKRAATIKKIKTFHAREGRAIRSLGDITKSEHLNAIRKAYREDIAAWLVKEMSAPTQRQKTKIRRYVNKLRAQLRKLESI